MNKIKDYCTAPLIAMKEAWGQASGKKRAAIVTLVGATALLGIALAILYSGHFNHLMNTQVTLLGKKFTVGQLLGYSTATAVGLTVLGMGIGAAIAKREQLKERIEEIVVSAIISLSFVGNEKVENEEK